MCVKAFVNVLLLFLVPFPYYLRVLIYYNFESEELELRRDAIEALNLQEPFDPRRGNVLQYLTPTHGVFIATYVFYFTSGLVIAFGGEALREKLKAIARGALQDMNNVSRTSVLQVVLRIFLWTFLKLFLEPMRLFQNLDIQVLFL